MLPTKKLEHFKKQLKQAKIDPLTGCKTWLYKHDSTGQPVYKAKMVWQFVHKLVYELNHSDDVMYMKLERTCGNPTCIAGAHLVLTTLPDDTEPQIDADAEPVKTRNANGEPLLGSAHRHAVLDEDKVLQIRRIYEQEHKSYVGLAAMFGVSRGAIQSIIERRTWRHI